MCYAKADDSNCMCKVSCDEVQQGFPENIEIINSWDMILTRNSFILKRMNIWMYQTYYPKVWSDII